MNIVKENNSSIVYHLETNLIMNVKQKKNYLYCYNKIDSKAFLEN